MLRIVILLFLMLSSLPSRSQETKTPPMKIGVVGLVHTHVHWVLSRASQGDFEIVGIVEPNAALAKRYLQQYQLPMDLVYSGIEEMLDQAKPEAVTAFNTIRDHLQVVALCAPRGIHVMVEKPLAVNLQQARKMAALAQEYGIYLMTNYETTWYGSHRQAAQLLSREHATFGDIRKIVVHDGHPGPKEIGVDPEFLEWLTDPYWNGGGALTDFGCYGANLSTWLHRGEKPTAVFAVTQQLKPHIYPKVDDEATLVVTYPGSQTIIQASWNWPYNRKDLEIYTQHGYIHCLNSNTISLMRSESDGAVKMEAPAPLKPFDDPFSYLMAVVRGEISIQASDLSSLENNLIVMEILEAARISASEGRMVQLSELE